MRKLTTIIFLLLFFANLAIAQQGEAEAPAAISSTFFNTIFSSGVVGILVWTVVLTMFPFAIILGIISIVCCIASDGKDTPFTFKWLMLSPLFYFFVGAIGVIIGTLSFSGVLAEPGTAGSTAVVAVGISSTINTGLATLIGMIPFFFFIIICMAILHFKRIPSALEEEVKDV